MDEFRGRGVEGRKLVGAEPQYRVNGRAWVPLKGCYKGTIKVPLQGITIRVLGVYTVSSFFVGSLKVSPSTRRKVQITIKRMPRSWWR